MTALPIHRTLAALASGVAILAALVVWRDADLAGRAAALPMVLIVASGLAVLLLRFGAGVHRGWMVLGAVLLAGLVAASPNIPSHTRTYLLPQQIGATFFTGLVLYGAWIVWCEDVVFYASIIIADGKDEP